jgi:hypothetical protein
MPVFIALLWVSGFFYAWSLYGLAAAAALMVLGPPLAAGLFSAVRDR